MEATVGKCVINLAESLRDDLCKEATQLCLGVKLRFDSTGCFEVVWWLLLNRTFCCEREDLSCAQPVKPVLSKTGLKAIAGPLLEVEPLAAIVAEKILSRSMRLFLILKSLFDQV